MGGASLRTLSSITYGMNVSQRASNGKHLAQLVTPASEWHAWQAQSDARGKRRHSVGCVNWLNGACYKEGGANEKLLPFSEIGLVGMHNQRPTHGRIWGKWRAEACDTNFPGHTQCMVTFHKNGQIIITIIVSKGSKDCGRYDLTHSNWEMHHSPSSAKSFLQMMTG